MFINPGEVKVKNTMLWTSEPDLLWSCEAETASSTSSDDGKLSDAATPRSSSVPSSPQSEPLSPPSPPSSLPSSPARPKKGGTLRAQASPFEFNRRTRTPSPPLPLNLDYTGGQFIPNYSPSRTESTVRFPNGSNGNFVLVSSEHSENSYTPRSQGSQGPSRPYQFPAEFSYGNRQRDRTPSPPIVHGRAYTQPNRDFDLRRKSIPYGTPSNFSVYNPYGEFSVNRRFPQPLIQSQS